MAEIANALSIPRALRLFQRKRISVSCASSDVVGDCLYVTGSKVGSLYQVAKASPSDPAKVPAMAILISKSDATHGIAQIYGEVLGLYTGFVPGAELFLGADGRPSHTPGSLRQSVGVALSDDVLLFLPSYDATPPIGAKLMACAESDAVGDCVYASSADTVTRSNPRVLSQMPSIGIIAEKLTDTSCLVRTSGFLEGVYSGLTVQAQAWVGLDGRLTENQAAITALPSGQVGVQQMGIATAIDHLLVQPQQMIVRIG